MDKSEFLKEISTMTRDQIQAKLNEKCKRVKKVWPVVILKPNNDNNNNKEKKKK